MSRANVLTFKPHDADAMQKLIARAEAETGKKLPLDEEGRVIDGDPAEIQEITDVWTFERPINSRDPNWRLIATEAD